MVHVILKTEDSGWAVLFHRFGPVSTMFITAFNALYDKKTCFLSEPGKFSVVRRNNPSYEVFIKVHRITLVSLYISDPPYALSYR